MLADRSLNALIDNRRTVGPNVYGIAGQVRRALHEPDELTKVDEIKEAARQARLLARRLQRIGDEADRRVAAAFAEAGDTGA